MSSRNLKINDSEIHSLIDKENEVVRTNCNNTPNTENKKRNSIVPYARQSPITNLDQGSVTSSTIKPKQKKQKYVSTHTSRKSKSTSKRNLLETVDENDDPSKFTVLHEIQTKQNFFFKQEKKPNDDPY